MQEGSPNKKIFSPPGYKSRGEWSPLLLPIAF